MCNERAIQPLDSALLMPIGRMDASFKIDNLSKILDGKM